MNIERVRIYYVYHENLFIFTITIKYGSEYNLKGLNKLRKPTR